MRTDTHVYMHTRHVRVYLIHPYFDLLFHRRIFHALLLLLLLTYLFTYLLTYCN
jgi:hypothetical protein